jgi:hypothetical protein
MTLHLTPARRRRRLFPGPILAHPERGRAVPRGGRRQDAAVAPVVVPGLGRPLLQLLRVPVLLGGTQAEVAEAAARAPLGAVLVGAGGGAAVLVVAADRVAPGGRGHAAGGGGGVGLTVGAVAAQGLDEVAHHGDGGGADCEGGLEEAPDDEGEGVV